MLIAADEGLTTQDLKIIKMVDKIGKAMAILVNKWDLTKGVFQKDFILDNMHRLKPYTYLPHLFISAKDGKNLFKILDLVKIIYEEQQHRVTTGILNRFLKKVVSNKEPSRRKGRRLKIYYISQVDRLPPTFLISINSKSLLEENYVRYLENQLRSSFGFAGSPIRLVFKED